MVSATEGLGRRIMVVICILPQRMPLRALQGAGTQGLARRGVMQPVPGQANMRPESRLPQADVTFELPDAIIVTSGPPVYRLGV
jgi:Glu-tRNA(Gln) amidotransferase subunit E-like FAD-binding protein